MLAGLVSPRILLIDDDVDIRALVRGLLPAYQVLEATTAAEGLALAFGAPPDLILLDRQLPDRDGIELLGALKQQLATRHVPVILLTAKGEVTQRVEGLNSGAHDYVTKPFAPAELVARVEATLSRTRDALVTDPLTRLPGNATLRAEIARHLAQQRSFSLCYVDLDNFKAYVDHYGFERASELIQRLAQLCDASLATHAPQGFLGHLGGDDFFFLVDQARAEPLVQSLLANFDAVAPDFYDEADRARGAIAGVDRYGTSREFPLVTLSVAVIRVNPGQFSDPRDLACYAAECKDRVKQREARASGTGSFERCGPPP